MPWNPDEDKFNLDPVSRDLLKRLQEHVGLSLSGTLKLCIREAAKTYGLTSRGPQDAPKKERWTVHFAELIVAAQAVAHFGTIATTPGEPHFKVPLETFARLQKAVDELE